MALSNYFSNRIQITKIKENLGILTTTDPEKAKLQIPGIQRLGNSAIKKINKREFCAFKDIYDVSKLGYNSFNKNTLAPITETITYYNPLDITDTTDEPYVTYSGPDKPSKGQIVMIEDAYTKGKITGDIRITNGDLSYAGITFPPSGTLGYFAYDNETPDGWLECAGQAVLYSRKVGTSYVDTEYTELYNTLDSWGIFTDIQSIIPGAGAGKVFVMPDLTGYFVRCMNITDQGLDANLDVIPTDKSKKMDVIDHGHHGHNMYNRVERVSTVWFRRPNKLSHRSGEFGEWTTKNWYPAESTGYENMYWGFGGGKYSVDGETNWGSEQWGNRELWCETYVDIDWRYLRGAPPGLQKTYINPWYDNESRSYYIDNTHRKHWENSTGSKNGDFHGAWSDKHDYFQPFSYNTDYGRFTQNSFATGVGYYAQKASEFSWENTVGVYQGTKHGDEHRIYGVPNGAYANHTKIYYMGWRCRRWDLHYDSDDYPVSHSSNDYNGGHNASSWHPPWWTLYQNLWSGSSTGRWSFTNEEYRNSWKRNPWFLGWDRHMHQNLFTYYRSTTFPNPDKHKQIELTERGWSNTHNGLKDAVSNAYRSSFDYYGWRINQNKEYNAFSHKFNSSEDYHERCNINTLQLRNAIHYTELKKNRYDTHNLYPGSTQEGGCNMISGKHQDKSRSPYSGAGYYGIPRRRYIASSELNIYHSNDTWSSFCYITKPDTGGTSGTAEEALLNSGDNGSFTEEAGDHSHAFHGGVDSVYYQGQEETRPHNIALRLFIKY